MTSHADPPVPDAPDELGRLRRQIDRLDAELVRLLAQRFQVTDDVGAVKAAHKLPAHDPQREAAQLARLTELCREEQLDPALLEPVFETITKLVKERHRRAAG